MYENELKAIKKVNRFREREIFDESLVDLASNDYLGLAEDRELFKSAVKKVENYQVFAPKASQLVNGYHPIHKEFEEYLSKLNGFSTGIVVGSGFLANLSLIEALPRKHDLLILDEFYHASGVLASKLVDCEVIYFKHNDMRELKEILDSYDYFRAIVCVEGIYSMEGDIVDVEVFDIVDRENVLLIVDEAHSSGVLGENLLGVFDHFGITPKKNHIKMGTLGKAYGSYGAFILADYEIIEFLQNRAKAIIYATAPSVFDIALAYENIKRVNEQKAKIVKKIDKIKNIVKEIFNSDLDGLILKLQVRDSTHALELKESAKKKGFIIGAIRPPTVEKAIVRIIPRVSLDIEILRKFLLELRDELYS
jgi:8-amino-7-oxononanoate synthase